MHKKTVVVHSGGMDSSLCLALAIKEFGADHVLSLSFDYSQRHNNEINAAKHICSAWGVDHAAVNLECLSALTADALTNSAQPISWGKEHAPSTLVVGRNGLMARLGAIHAHSLGADCIYMGVIEEEAREIGYRDCSKAYIELKQQILRLDLGNPLFEIRTPLIDMSKAETLQLAHSLGILDFLWENTVTCYNGVMKQGCGKCPACFLRNRGLEIAQKHLIK
ncbi:MAG: 7-cyano-7-deazaguanine synthase QueC [Parachlamydiales bacterium]|jgi:7-cyano-7-deazaguanine synthase